MGFLWVTGFSFFHCVASPFHSFVTTLLRSGLSSRRLFVRRGSFARWKMVAVAHLIRNSNCHCFVGTLPCI